MENTSSNVGHYHEDDICITAFGCVLPDSRNVVECWTNLLKGESLLEEVPKNYFDKNLFYDPTGTIPERTVSCSAVMISDSITNEKRLELDLNNSFNDMQVLLMAAFDEMYQMLNVNEINPSKVGFSVGAMMPDKDLYAGFLEDEDKIIELIKSCGINETQQQEALKKVENFFAEKKQTIKRHADARYPTSMIQRIKERYCLRGEEVIIDAACAGGLAAFEVACKMLKNDDLDIVFTGAIESNIPTSTFLMFSAMQALAPDKSFPFDKSSLGTSMGEGSVMFAIQKVKTAIKNNHKILGVIKGAGQSNNGSNASLFSLSKESILTALSRAYENVPDSSLDYLECHGSGTRIGDPVELEAVSDFWKSSNLTIGTSKAVFGHGKGVAGATGILKALLTIKNKTIAPSPYFKEFKTPFENISVNTKPLPINKESPIKVGVSSLGFGGANFHLYIEEFNNNYKLIPSKSNSCSPQLAIISQVEMTKEQLDEFDLLSTFKIPPRVVERTDRSQLNALITTHLALNKIGARFNIVNRSRIGVISLAPTGLDFSDLLDKRVKYTELSALFQNDSNSLVTGIEKIKSQYPSITEDCAPGVLSNVIAGRVCEKFNFTGKSYNIDADNKDLPFALKMAAYEIQDGLDAIVLTHSDRIEERVPTYCGETVYKRTETGFATYIVTSLDFAKKNALPIEAVISDIKHSTTGRDQ